MKKFFTLLLIATAALSLGLSQPVLAVTTGGSSSSPGAQTLELLGKTGLGGSESAAEAGNRLPVIIGNIVRILLGLLGIILVVLLVYAGFLWMTARGASEQVDKAKDIIRNAIIGIAIVLLAYAITGFVVSSILNASQAT